MKKLFAALAALTLCFGLLAGCTSKDAPTRSTTANSATSETAPDSTPSVNTPEADPTGVSEVSVDIVNMTGVDIIGIYISLSEVDEWEEELLGGNAFGDEEVRTFTATLEGTESNNWDFLVVDEDEDVYAFFEVSLASVVEVQIHWGDGYTPTISTVLDSGSEKHYTGYLAEE